jgi:hypothetical protein
MSKPLNIKSLLVWLIATSFVVLQSAALAHEFEFGDEEHEHDGNPCIIAIYGDRLGDGLPQPAVVLDFSGAGHDHVIPVTTTIILTTQNNFAQSRAPPFVD